jgi:hypothetical protein
MYILLLQPRGERGFYLAFHWQESKKARKQERKAGSCLFPELPGHKCTYALAIC